MPSVVAVSDAGIAVSDPDAMYVARLYLAELAARGDARAADILSLHSLGALRNLADTIPACRVVIAVCTAKRPGMLRHCLESLGGQIVPSQVDVHILVVDNEGEANNLSLVQEFSARCPFPVHYAHEPRRGIPQARNAALARSRALGPDWIALTDDDCWVSPTWLASLLDAAGKHGADVVYGRREFLFPVPLPFWAMRSEQGAHAEGDVLRYAGTHNVLLTARLVCDDTDMRFDESLPHGEDTDFFHRAAQRGARIVYSAEPLVLEVVSPDRATLHHQTRRAYYYAASRSYFHRRHKGTRAAAVRLAARCAFQVPLAIGRLVAAPFAWPFSEDAFRDLVNKGAQRLAGAAGAVAGLLGQVGDPYQSIDGY